VFRHAAGIPALLAFLLLAQPHTAVAAITVVTTTQDLKSLTEAVGGSLVQALSLVPPGTDAEAYEPRPGDLLRLADASIIVRVGLGYDDWLDRLLAQHGDARLMPGRSGQVDASAGIPLLDVQSRSVEVQAGGHAHGLANPHYWLDPANARIITASIAASLARVAPEQAGQFTANRDNFLRTLDARLAIWGARLTPYAGSRVIAYHNGWPYFARRFRLHIVAVLEPKEDVPPSPLRLAHIASEMRTANVKAVLVRPQEPREPTEAIAARSGAHIALLAGSVGELSGADDYLSLFELDVSALLASLRNGG
jgi:manganese/iron transport system substrate-binding protein